MCKTDYGGGGGGKNVSKIDYVICERPLVSRKSLKIFSPSYNSRYVPLKAELPLPDSFCNGKPETSNPKSYIEGL